jgi:hypothetical protein
MKKRGACAESRFNTRQDLLEMIRDRIAMINDGDISEPVYLKNVTVLDKERSFRKPLYLRLNSIFCDEAGTLCGDLVGGSDPFNGGIFFGQSLEHLGLDELENIMDSLSGDDFPLFQGEKKAGGIEKISAMVPFLRKVTGRREEGASIA